MFGPRLFPVLGASFPCSAPPSRTRRRLLVLGAAFSYSAPTCFGAQTSKPAPSGDRRATGCPNRGHAALIRLDGWSGDGRDRPNTAPTVPTVPTVPILR